MSCHHCHKTDFRTGDAAASSETPKLRDDSKRELTAGDDDSTSSFWNAENKMIMKNIEKCSLGGGFKSRHQSWCVRQDRWFQGIVIVPKIGEIVIVPI